MTMAATQSVAEVGSDAIEWLSRSLVPWFGNAAAIVLFDPGGSVCDAVGVHVDRRLSDAVRCAALLLAQSGDPPLRDTVAAHGSVRLHIGDDRIARDSDLGRRLAGIGGHALACASIETQGTGILMVMSPESRRWADRDLRVLKSFSHCIEEIFEPAASERREDNFVAEVRHDLCNPIEAVTLNLEQLVSDRAGNSTEREACLGRAMRSVRRMHLLVAELDEYLNAGVADDTPTSEAGPAVEEVVEMLSPLGQTRGISLRSDIKGDMIVKIAPRHLFRVLSNLVANAVKYAGRDTEVVVHAARFGERARFIVQDHGPGIAAESCRRLFDRAWLATSALRKGSGLGLAICKRLVESHGGSLGVISTLGSGSFFVVELECC